MKRSCNILVLGLLSTLVMPGVWAHEPVVNYDRISFSASAQSEVDNDLLSAELFVQREGSDAARLAKEVNQDIEWAVSEAKQIAAVEVRTQGYRTHPVYMKQHLSAWRVRQSIQLKSADTSALSDLIGRLQGRLAVESVGYELSPEVRADAEDRMIQKAIAAFSRRAVLVTEKFGRPGYRLVNVNITSTGSVPRPMYQSRAMAMSMEQAVPAPTLKPGTQTVRVTVDGMIELKVQ